MNTVFHLAQLRHLYDQMVNGDVKNTAEAARGLLGPAIEHFEQQQTPKPAPGYFSFLVCYHGNIINIYYNGVPIGIIQDGIFTVHHYIRNGVKVPMTFEDLPQPCTYSNIDELLTDLHVVLSKIQLPSRTDAKA